MREVNLVTGFSAHSEAEIRESAMLLIGIIVTVIVRWVHLHVYLQALRL